jgi:hypothetical protein
MKRLLLIVTALVALLPFRSFADEALDGFKKEVAAVKAFSDDMDKKAKEDPFIVFKMFGDLAAKIGEVETDGVPADIKEPWEAFAGITEKMAAVMAEFPKDKAELEKKVNDNATMEAFSKKMEAMVTEMKPHLEKLKAAATKYSIPALAEMGPKP